MICIMLYHQTWINSGAFFSWMQMIGYIGVEVFLFISGFGITHSLKKNTLEQYYKNRVTRLLPACLTFGILKIGFSFIPSMPPIQNIFLDLFSLSQWYIYAITIYYLLAPFIYKLVNRIGGKALLIIIIITSITIYLWQYDANAAYLIKFGRWIVKRLPVFVFGMLIAMRPIKWNIAIVTISGCAFFSLNLLASHYIILANASSSEVMALPTRIASMLPERTVIPDNGRYLLDMMSVFFLIPCFSFLAYMMQKAHAVFPINWIGTYSLEIYLCHQYIYAVIMQHWPLLSAQGLIMGITASLTTAFIIKILSNPLKTALTHIHKNEDNPYKG